MQQQIRLDIISLLKKALVALGNEDELSLSNISNETIHNASIYQDEDSINVGVFVYAVSKLMGRHHVLPEDITNYYIPHVSQLIASLSTSDIASYREDMTALLKHMETSDEHLHEYVNHVVDQAKLKKSAKIYDHGISLAQSAQQLGVSQWQLYNYVGQTTMSDSDDSHVANMKKRLSYARSLLKSSSLPLQKDAKQKKIVFDSGPIITLALNNLLWTLPKIKHNFDGDFIVPHAVKYELVDRPLATRKYKLESMQIIPYFNDDTFKLVDSLQIHTTSKTLSAKINSIYSAHGQNITILQAGEIDALSCALLYGADGVVVDERNTRYLVETPHRLQRRLERKLHTKIIVDESVLKEVRTLLKGIRVIRSAELLTIAFEQRLIDSYLCADNDVCRIINASRKHLLEGLLWGLKLHGCAISETEIIEILAMEKKYY